MEGLGTSYCRKIGIGKMRLSASAASIWCRHTDLNIRVRHGRLKAQLLEIRCIRTVAVSICCLLKTLDPVHEILIHDYGIEMSCRTFLNRLNGFLG